MVNDKARESVNLWMIMDARLVKNITSDTFTRITKVDSSGMSFKQTMFPGHVQCAYCLQQMCWLSDNPMICGGRSGLSISSASVELFITMSTFNPHVLSMPPTDNLLRGLWDSCRSWRLARPLNELNSMYEMLLWLSLRKCKPISCEKHSLVTVVSKL